MLQTLSTMITDFGILQLALVSLVVIFAAIMRAFTGFGFALAAVPAFTLLMSPVESVVLSIMLTFAVSLLTVKTFWGQVAVKPMVPLISFSFLGTLIGAFVVGAIDASSFQLWIGLTVIGACGLLAVYKPKAVQPRAGVSRVIGLASGLMNGVFAVPGPPVIIYVMATQPDAIKARATLLAFLMFSAAFGLIAYAAAGYLSMNSLWLFILSCPAMVVGDRIGYGLFNRFGTAAHKKVAVGVLLAVGFAITAKALLVG